VSEWVRITDRLPQPEGGWVVVYGPGQEDESDFPGLPVMVCNPRYVGGKALADGYTHWCAITFPPCPTDQT
jgi:hypothetical protein